MTKHTPEEKLQALGVVLTYGAKKYGEYNWTKGFCYSRLLGALMRYILSFWKGENTDPESGIPHLYHAFANLTFLITHEQRKIGIDDRKI